MTNQHRVTSLIEFEHFLKSLDQQVEAIATLKSKAEFQRLLGEPHADLTVLNARLTEILLDEQNRSILNHWKASVTEPRSARQAAVFAKIITAAAIDNDPELYELQNAIEQQIVTFQPELNGRAVSRSETEQILEIEPDRELRRKAYYARKALDTKIESDVLRLFALRTEKAQSLGFKDYVSFGLASQDLNEAELLALFTDVAAATDQQWSQILDLAAMRLKVRELKPWDLSYFVHGLTPTLQPERFPKAGIIPAFEKVLRALGGELTALPIQVYERDIPYGGLCMVLEYGKDIRILANPRDGLMWYDALFHEFGHGIHASLVDASSHVVASADPAFFWEGIAGLFQGLVQQPKFLHDTFGLTDQEIAKLAVIHRLNKIRSYRTIAITCQLEWSVYRGEPNPSAHLSGLTNRLLGIDLEAGTGWAGNTLYTTHPLYSQNYLLMDVFAGQASAAITRQVGEYPCSGFFDYVVQSYIAPAGWIPWGEKILAATGQQLTAAALTGGLEIALDELG